MQRKAILCPDVPKPIVGSHAVKAGDFVFVGGQIPTDYRTGLVPEAMVGRGADEPVVASRLQSEAILRNTEKILREAGSSLELGVRIDQFCTHPDAASPYLEVRTRHIDPQTRPSSTHIQIESLLVPQALCGLQVIALTEETSAKKEVVVVPDLSTSPGPPFKPSPQASTAGDFVFVTGQVASDFQSGLAAEVRKNPDFWYGSPIKLQTEYILKRFEIILKASQSSLRNVVRADVYLTDMKDFHQFEEVWKNHFPEEPPARTFIPVKRLGPKNCIVEINMIALKEGGALTKETVHADGVPKPDVHHPHAVRAGDFVFLSGMYATDFAEGLASEARISPGLPWFDSSAKKQTEYILKNMDAICGAAGTRLENVVWMQSFYTDPADFFPASEVWRTRFPKAPPALLTGQVQPPHLIEDCTILFDAVAIADD